MRPRMWRTITLSVVSLFTLSLIATLVNNYFIGWKDGYVVISCYVYAILLTSIIALFEGFRYVRQLCSIRSSEAAQMETRDWPWRTIAIGSILFILTLVLATLLNHYVEKWKDGYAIANNYMYAALLAFFGVLIEVFWSVGSDVKKAIADIPKVIQTEVERVSVREPSLIQRGYEDIVKTLLDISNPEMQKEIITFAQDALKGICKQEGNGFPLSGQGFPSYKEKAELFYSAAKNCLHMTCLYCPLEYFLQFVNEEPDDPEHLLIFNGMSGDTGCQPPDRALDRIRVMCVRDKLGSSITLSPKVFGAAFVWFLFHNIHFALFWSTEKPPDDIIIIDERYMWKYLPKARMLYLKCAWNVSGVLQEEGKWFSMAAMSQNHAVFQKHLIGARKAKLWNQFVKGLKDFLELVIQESKVTTAGEGLKAFGMLADSLIVFLSLRQKEYKLLERVKTFYRHLWQSDPEAAKAFNQYMLATSGSCFCMDVRSWLETEIRAINKKLRVYEK